MMMMMFENIYILLLFKYVEGNKQKWITSETKTTPKTRKKG